jgi:glycosyltransferase involved in cell wall biosynthesis
MEEGMSKKRILYVEQNKDGTIGGSHYCLLYLIQGLDRSLYEPIIVFYENNPIVGKFKIQGETTIVDNMRYLTKGPSAIRKIINLILTLMFIIKCYSFINRKKIDLVHLNNTVAGGYDTWLVASLLARIPCITHERNYLKQDAFKHVLFKLMSKKFSKVLTVSNVIRDNLIAKGFDAYIVETVYDGIEAPEYRRRVKRSRGDVVTEFGIPPDHYLIGLVGNIREWKGQELLIESLNILKRDFPDFNCLLIGDLTKNSDIDVRYKERLVSKINDYGLSDRVIFTGYRSDVPDLINALDVQINASIEPDPFPHVILEGMSLGKVVIATNMGGAIESVEDGESGFLVSAHDPQQLADRIKRVLLDNSLRESMASKASQRVERLFSIERNISHTQDVYVSLLKR